MKKAKFLSAIVAALSLVAMTGCASNKPYIGENGNWWVGDSDLGVPATGPQGETGPQGPKGEGVTVVSVEKTGSSGLVDTYTITFSDGTKTTFTVTNGPKGDSITVVDVSIQSSENGVDTYLITFSDGYTTTFTVTNGKDGKNLSVVSIELVSSSGLCDTYRITYSDDSYVEFVVTNGATPYIGENGNWWINGVDTGVLADSSREDKRNVSIAQKIMSTGLKYETTTINGKSGLIVSGYDVNYVSAYIGMDSTYEEYWKFKDLMTYDEYIEIGGQIESGYLDLVIPNYVGNTPVIGISDVFKSTRLKSISLSKNTEYISEYAFYNCSELRNVDFNGSQITRIPSYCFAGSGVSEVELPDTVVALDKFSFSGCDDVVLDYSNIVFFGKNAIDSMRVPYIYLDSDVEYVGENALPKYSFIYVENGTNTDNWADLDKVQHSSYKYTNPILNCEKNDEYIYSVSNNETTLYRYLGNERKLNVVSSIDGKNVTKLGYGFCWMDEESMEIEYSLNGEKFGNYLVNFDEVIIPNTVKTIDKYTLNLFGSLIYIPKSVNKMWWGVGMLDGDDIASSYLAFEGTISEMPSVFESDESSTASGQAYYTERFEDGARISYSVDKTKLYRDEESKTYYLDEGLSYSLFAFMDFDLTDLVIPSSINEKPVYTIKSGAVAWSTNLKTVKISNGITKIQKHAFLALELKAAYIPLSVAIINSYGFECGCSLYKVAAPMKPEEWDTYWAGSNTSSQNVEYGSSANYSFGSIGGFDYLIEDNEVSLLKYNGSSNVIYLPSVIEGKPVTTIKTGFFTNRYVSKYVYIPSSITKAEANAFAYYNSSSYTSYFYFESASLPTGFDSMWTGSTSTYYTNLLYNQTLPEYDFSGDFVYEVNADKQTVTLLQYNGQDKNIRIPRAIDGKIVTGIAGNFYSVSTYGITVYIPKTVTTIGSSSNYAFLYTSSSYTLTVNFEGASGSVSTSRLYSYSSSSYLRINWNQNIGY